MNYFIVVCVNAVSAILDVISKCPKQRQSPCQKNNFKDGVAVKGEKSHLFKILDRK